MNKLKLKMYLIKQINQWFFKKFLEPSRIVFQYFDSQVDLYPHSCSF